MTNSDKEVLRNMIERKAGALIDTSDDLVMATLGNNPAICKMALTFVNAKKKEYLPQIQDYCDALIETACMDPDISLNDAIRSVEETLSDFITNFIAEKLSLAPGTVQITLQLLEANKLIAL